jgi:hypothetical protein
MKKFIKAFVILCVGLVSIALLSTVNSVSESASEKAVAITAVQQASDTTSGHVMADVAIDTGKKVDTFLPMLFALLQMGVIVGTAFGVIYTLIPTKQETNATPNQTKE